MPILIGVKCCLIGLICGSLSRVRLNIFSSIGFSSGFLPCKFPADIICPSFCYILCWLFQIYMLHIYLLSVCSLSVHFAYVFWEQLMLLNLFLFFLMKEIHINIYESYRLEFLLYHLSYKVVHSLHKEFSAAPPFSILLEHLR